MIMRCRNYFSSEISSAYFPHDFQPHSCAHMVRTRCIIKYHDVTGLKDIWFDFPNHWATVSGFAAPSTSVWGERVFAPSIAKMPYTFIVHITKNYRPLKITFASFPEGFCYLNFCAVIFTHNDSSNGEVFVCGR